MLEDLAPFQDDEILWSAADVALVPVMPFSLRANDVAISMFAVVSTFGTA